MRVKDLLNYSASFYKKDCSQKIKELAARMDLDLNRKIDDLSFGNKKKSVLYRDSCTRPT